MSSVRTGDALEVSVRLGAPGDGTAVPLSSFTLLVGGEPRAGRARRRQRRRCPDPVAAHARPLTSCDVVFASREGTATLSFSHGGQQRLWHLDPASA